MDNSMYKKIVRKVRIEGKGQSKEHTIANALGKIQKTVNAEYSGMIIRIEPINIEIIEALEETYTERFLLFLLPRKRSEFKLVMDIEVDMFLLETDNIDFRVKKR
jgi:uncharacterized protein (TIGR03578 family)